MAITSRASFLTRQLATLESELETIKSKGEAESWVREQILETKDRLYRVNEQFKKWEVENELRRHNFIGLVRDVSHFFVSSTANNQYFRYMEFSLNWQNKANWNLRSRRQRRKW